MAQPLSIRLQDGIRFFDNPLPAPATAFLAVRLPEGRRYGLTMFRVNNTSGVDPAYPPVALLSVCPHHIREHPATYLLVQACQHLWLVEADDV